MYQKITGKYLSLFRFWKLPIACCLLPVALSLLSCNTIRHTLREPLRDKGADYLFDNLHKNELHYKWFSAKFSATVEYNNKKNSFNGIIRIKNDSLIWISITPILGIEAARIMISPDSVWVIDRFHKTFIKTNYDFINKMLNTDFDYDMIESLVTGNDLDYYDIDKFKARIENREYKLTTVNRQKIKKFVRRSSDYVKILLQDIWLDPETFKITRTNLHEIKENRRLDVKYNDFRGVSNQICPNKIIFEVEDKNPMKIYVKYSKIAIDEPLSFPFKIPSDYDKQNNRD